MAIQLSKAGIAVSSSILAWHVSQSIDAFTGVKAYNITQSGSLNLTGSIVTGSISNATSASHAITASYALNGGSGGGVGTLQQVMSSGSSTTIAITGSHISASGTGSFPVLGITSGAGIGFGFNGGGNEASDIQFYTDGVGEISFIKGGVNVLDILSDNTVEIKNNYDLVAGANITASGAISASGIVSMTTASVGGGLFTSASLAAGGSGTTVIANPGSSGGGGLTTIGIGGTNYSIAEGGGPIQTHTSNFTASAAYNGKYNIVGGNLAIAVQTSSGDLAAAMEWNFFQTSSGNTFTFTPGTGVTLISKNNHKKLAAQGSAATLKYISGQTFHLVGDLTL